MITSSLLDQLLKSGQGLLQNKGGQSGNVNSPGGGSGDFLSGGGGLGNLISGFGGGAFPATLPRHEKGGFPFEWRATILIDFLNHS